MERSLVERSIALHGSALGKLVAEEQGETNNEYLPPDPGAVPAVAAEAAAGGVSAAGDTVGPGKGQVPQKPLRLVINAGDLKSNVKRPIYQQQKSG